MTREKYSQDPSSLNDSDILVKVACGEKNEFTERGNFYIIYKHTFLGIYKSSDGNELYVIGVIDTLTDFTFKKRLEYIFKRCRYGHEMSCIPPQQYCERFYDFMVDTVFKQ